MKCDELRDYEVVLSTEYQFVGGVVFRSKKFYSKDSVDEAIDELKAENEKLNKTLDKERSETIKYMDELCNAKNEIERLTIDKRNAELRADVADATVEKLKAKNRKLQRALYKACANWAFAEHVRYVDISDGSQGYKQAQEQWEKMSSKCRAKAKELK